MGTTLYLDVKLPINNGDRVRGKITLSDLNDNGTVDQGEIQVTDCTGLLYPPTSYCDQQQEDIITRTFQLRGLKVPYGASFLELHSTLSFDGDYSTPQEWSVYFKFLETQGTAESLEAAKTARDKVRDESIQRWTKFFGSDEGHDLMMLRARNAAELGNSADLENWLTEAGKISNSFLSDESDSIDWYRARSRDRAYTWLRAICSETREKEKVEKK